MYLKNHVNLLSRKGSTASHPSGGIYFLDPVFLHGKKALKTMYIFLTDFTDKNLKKTFLTGLSKDY